jgi:hypothetical protein
LATSPQERLTLGIELNDGVNFTIESLVFNPAQKKPLYVSNADADGEALVRESHYTPANFELKVRVEPQASIHAGLIKLGELTDAIQACEKVERGQALEWTPASTEDTYTVYVLSGDITGIPIEVEGDGAGWLLGAPVVTIKLTCRPFLHLPERTVLTTTESAAEPLQVRHIKGILGDVPAEARLIVSDKASQDRRFAMWGRDVVTSEAPPTLLLTAKSGLTGAGFSGESKTRSGAYSEEKVLRGIAVSQPTTLCGTGRIENVGSYAIYLRVYATSEAARFRISYRSGDGPLRPLEWKQAPVVNGWSEIYLGVASLDAVTLGTQTGEIRVEQKATTGNPANDVNYLMLWPTKAQGKARGIARYEPSKLIAYDNFEQTTGSLEGKELGFPSGTTWAEINKTGENGFKVTAEHVAERAKVSDANLNSGCFATVGTTTYSTVSISGSFIATTSVEGAIRLGLLARYVSTESWLMAALVHESGDITKGSVAGPMGVYLIILKRVAGTPTTLGYAYFGSSMPSDFTQTGQGIGLYVGAEGSWSATIKGQTIASGYDASLAPGGTLEKGRVGIYDAWTSATANSRKVDRVSVLGAEDAGRVCYSGKQLEFNSRGCLRQDSAGTYDGPPSSYRGSGFYLEPEGKLGLINRVVTRMRRNDNEAEEDSVVTDKHAVEVKSRERFLLPR